LPRHRRIYLEYEGEISGDRGSVRRVDGGECRVREWTDELLILELRGDQLVGPLVLRKAREAGERPWWFRLGKLS
jgi:hypothetical protein